MLVVAIIPAALMVSRIRYRSFNAMTPGRRHSYLTLIVIAGVIAAIAILPQAVLVVMAYTYLLSGPTGMAVSKLRWRHARVAADAAPSQKRSAS